MKSLSQFVQDARYGFRMLRAAPALSLLAVVSLAFGIGATSAMFAVVHAALFRPVPVSAPEDLWFLYTGNEERPYGRFSYPDYVDYRDALDDFDGLAAYGEIAASLAAGDGVPESTRGVIVTGSFFEVLGITAQRGRLIGPDDDRTPGQHPVVVLSDRLWRGRFGADPGIVGKQLRLNGHAYDVVGVTPPGFLGPDVLESYDIYVPMMMQGLVRPPRAGFSGEMDPDLLDRRGASWLAVLGRLSDSGSPAEAAERARGSVDAVARRLANAHPDTNARRTTATIFPLSRIDPRGWPVLRSIALLLMAAVGLVLLVSTANVANLLLARAVSRRREIALRLALGGGRGRIVRQLLTESLVLAGASGIAGLLLAGWVLDALAALVPERGMFSFTLDFRIDPQVLAFTSGVSVLVAVLVGLAPALRASRADLLPTIKDPESGAKRARFGGRRALVLAQLSLSIVLLVAAGLFLRSFLFSSAIETGFAEEEILTADLSIDLLQYTTARGQAFYREVVERADSLGGVASASLVRVVPLQGGGRTSRLAFEGSDAVEPAPGDELTVLTNVVGADYFPTMGIPLLRGRDLEPRDTTETPRVVVVNQSFVDTFFAGEEPLGRRLRIDEEEELSTIVGVAADSKYLTLGEPPRPHVYQALGQTHETGMTLLVRTRAGASPEGLIDPIRRELHALEPDLPVSRIELLATLVESALFPARMAARLMTVLAALTLMLASIGLYGVMSFAVSERTREMGIRMALGARPRQVAELVLGEGLSLVAAGIAIGSVAALAGTRLLASFLYGVTPADPVTFGAVVFVLGIVMLLTAYLPARKAAGADPLVALRHD